MKYLAWLLVIPLYYLSSLAPRKKGRYVFGAWHGEKYADNSKYLMEYILKEHKECEVYWMTRDKKLLNFLKSKKIPAIKINSLKGLYICATAEYTFTCTGPWDVNRFTTNNTNWVNLWHGSPLKKIGLDRKQDRNSMQRLTKKISSIIFPFNIEHYTTTIAPSEFVEQCFKSAFAGLSKQFIRAGYPRNDALDGEVIKNQYLYLPTHRGEGDGSINKIFSELNVLALEETLAKKNATLIIKPHFYDIDKISDIFDKCKCIKIETQDDTYKLMAESNFLITDYSSVALDFAITKRPVIFFAPDLKEYQEKDRDLYIDYEKITDSRHITTWEELILSIESNAQNHIDAHKTINDLFNQDIEKNYCEKLFRSLTKK
jgi:CDP-glycerol glycerophosphotransferase (TagB/SpsB family)